MLACRIKASYRSSTPTSTTNIWPVITCLRPPSDRQDMHSSRSDKCFSANFMNGQVLAFSTFLFGLLETPISSLAIQPPHRRSDATDQQHHLRPPHFQPLPSSQTHAMSSFQPRRSPALF
ncbi:hypothetical protein FALCPG4_005022 [Fusarium falciforme]